MQAICRIDLLKRNGFIHQRIIYLILLFIFALCSSVFANASTHSINTKDFSSRILGDWIGVCEQTVDGKKTPSKCFTLKISQTGSNTFNSKISYYKKDESGNKYISCGETVIATTVYQDGTAKSEITGNGLAYLDGSFKKETHTITEKFKAVDINQLEGIGSGSMCVNGVALNMGKNGKITKSKTTWSISDDTLTIDASMNIKFSFLCFGKNSKVKTIHKARRGTDIALADK